MKRLRWCALFSTLIVAAGASAQDGGQDSGVDAVFEPGKGLVVTSDDGDFSLAVRARGQIRATLRTPEAGGGRPGDLFVDGDDVDFSLAIRRARIVLSGWFFGRDNRYRIQLGVSPSDMDVNEEGIPTRTPLLDYYLEFRQLRELSVRVGQYVLPFRREREISSGSLAMVDRSLLNNEFGLDRDVGLHLFSSDLFGLGLFRYWAGISAAEGRDAGLGTDLGFAYLARFEVLPLGMFDDYTQTDLARRTQPRLAFGLSYVFIDDAPGNRGITGRHPADGGRTDYQLATADMLFKWAGLTLEAEVTLRFGSREPGGGVDPMGNPIPVEPPRDGIGWFVQADYLFPGDVNLDIAARFSMLEPIGDADSTSFPTRRELGIGVGWYFHGHELKLQADYFHLWSEDIAMAEDRVRLQLSASL